MLRNIVYCCKISTHQVTALLKVRVCPIDLKNAYAIIIIHHTVT